MKARFILASLLVLTLLTAACGGATPTPKAAQPFRKIGRAHV